MTLDRYAPRLAWRGALPVLLTLTLGCEGPAVFTDLARGLVPEPDEGYQPEGRRLRDGEFHSLGLERAPPSQDFVLAIDGDGDLLIQSMGSGDGCWVRDVAGYQPAVWRSFDLDDARLPFTRVDEAGETLYFASFDCEVAEVAVPGGRVVEFLPLPDERGALVEDGDGRIFAVSPWREEAVELGRRVLSEDHPFRYSLLIHEGQLVLYDVAGEALVALGTQVVGALLLPNAGEILVADATGGVAAIPLEGDGPATVWLSDQGCDLVDAGPDARVAAFYSPCGARRLVLYRPAAPGEPIASVRLSADAHAPRIVTRSLALEHGVEADVMSALFFRELEPSEESAVRRGQLWAQSAGEPPYTLLDTALDSWMLPAFDDRRAQQRVVAFALVPAAGETPDLVAVDAEQRLTVARRVQTLFESKHSLSLVTEDEEGRKDLVVLESSPFDGVTLREPELLLSNALAGLELDRTVVLEDVADMGPSLRDGEGELWRLIRTGPASNRTLHVVRQSQIDGAFADPKPLTEDAGPLYSFSANLPDTVLALVGSNRGSYRLEQLGYGEPSRTIIGRNVTSYHESVVPGGLGLVYATGGPDPGLYYSSLR